MNELIFFIDKAVLSGITSGSIYALGAVGITLIFAVMRFAHFAHADVMTVGAGLCLLLTSLLPTPIAFLGLPTGFTLLPIAMLITAVIAIFLDRVFYAPLRSAKTKPAVFVMASLGVALMLQGLLRLFSGTQPRNFFSPTDRKEIFRFEIPLDGVTRKISVSEPQILIIIFTMIAVTCLHLFLKRSKLGKAMRAVSDNEELARTTGIDVDRVISVTWVIAASLAAAAGTLLAMDVAFKPDLSFNMLLSLFAAAIVGGVGKPYGAIAGGYLIGLCESFAVFNWSVLLRPLVRMGLDIDVPNKLSFVATEYKLAVPFVIMLAVLAWRPTGIFKGRVL